MGRFTPPLLFTLAMAYGALAQDYGVPESRAGYQAVVELKGQIQGHAFLQQDQGQNATTVTVQVSRGDFAGPFFAYVNEKPVQGECSTTGSVYDPHMSVEIAYLNACLNNRSMCMPGDLTHRYGFLRSMNMAMNTGVNLDIPFTELVNRALVISTEFNRPIACATIMRTTDAPRIALARFDVGPMVGRVEFTAVNTTNTMVTVMLTRREGAFTSNMWAIHAKPVFPGDLTCQSTEGVYDPLNLKMQSYWSLCQNNSANCVTGDLGGRLGALVVEGDNMVLAAADPTLSLVSIANRSLVVKGGDGTILACGTITQTIGPNLNFPEPITPQPDTSLSTGAIIGIVFGCIAFVVLLVVGVVFCVRKARTNAKINQTVRKNIGKEGAQKPANWWAPKGPLASAFNFGGKKEETTGPRGKALDVPNVPSQGSGFWKQRSWVPEMPVEMNKTATWNDEKNPQQKKTEGRLAGLFSRRNQTNDQSNQSTEYNPDTSQVEHPEDSSVMEGDDYDRSRDYIPSTIPTRSESDSPTESTENVHENNEIFESDPPPANLAICLMNSIRTSISSLSPISERGEGVRVVPPTPSFQPSSRRNSNLKEEQRDPVGSQDLQVPSHQSLASLDNSVNDEEFSDARDGGFPSDLEHEEIADRQDYSQQKIPSLPSAI
eukprot:comp18918_c1_seq1/m.21101 comp18918_c1_seq1/g.21101  ORF comp18918_c1_seq1/g.21101 comp18918_c1_seq1/m.21101 type:complete len:660 (-) comp18918_c1_seq1:343-2322(-)